MQLTAILLTICSLTVAARSVSQSVTFTGKDVPLEKIFSVIEEQTGHFVLYKEGLLANAKPVTVDAVRMPLADFLSMIFKHQTLGYSVQNTSIIVEKINAAPKLNMQEVKPPVTGRVVGPDGQPIAGANVVVKGTKKGTVTGADGSFNIEANEGEVIFVSSVGYANKQILLTNSSIGTVSLILATSKLDEVQIIAYGQTSRRLTTSNISSVKSEDIQKQPVNNPLLALAGRVPGLQITQSSGFSGGGISVLIQGQNSFFNGNDPFYVIDGVPYFSQLLPNLGNIFGTSRSAGLSPGENGNPLSYINPADILSIEVLKDADATAIYGSRGANGVILITTKKGRPGKTQVDFNIQTGIGNVIRKLDVLNTPQYLQMRREAKQNAGASVGASDYDINGDWNETDYTDWQKELIGNTSKYNDFRTSISGGNEMVKYIVGAGYHKETTVFPGQFNDQKGSLNFNINTTSQNKKFKFDISGNYLVDDNKLPSTDFTLASTRLAPNAPYLINDDGTVNWAPNSLGISTWQYDNPVAGLLNKYNNVTNNLIASSNMSYRLINGLEAKATFGYTNLQTDEMTTEVLGSVPPENRAFSTRRARYGTNKRSSWLIEPQLQYSRKISLGDLTALVGTTIQQQNSNRRLIEGTGYSSDEVLDNINAATDVVVPENSTIQSVYKYNALFGRINYNWNNKYLINLSARRDGSSRFGSANRFHDFGAIGIGWIFTEESFINYHVKFLSFGKLRASYGTMGSDAISDYRYMSLYRNENRPVPYRGGTSLVPDGLSNPFLQWEETKKLSASVDLGFMNDRILFTATYFRNRSSNQLLSYALPSVTGFGQISSNFPATIQNTGWELSLSTKNIQNKNISWTTNINITLPRNKLAKFNGLDSSSYANEYQIGQPMSATRVYNHQGVNETTGLYQFFDKEGNLVADPSVDPANKTILINTSQRLYGGLQNSLSYKNISIDFLFQFVKQLGQGNFFGNSPGATRSNQPISVLERWQKPGDKSSIQKFSTRFSDRLSGIAANESNAVWEDASYVRLKNLSLSWQLPQKIAHQIHLQNARIFCQGQNLLTITKFSGLDPETRNSSSLPPLRILTLGIQITL